ncbi:RelE/ParE family plasmid stabilization system protein (plasmid) [Pseudomonas syringae pv. avii]|uniref:Plasmid stabilization system protein n=6 Tax=Pseudomonas syringae group TaxID=136849 RepID=A0A3M4AQM9_9PSED|nr:MULTISPECIES: type II toxin-antitoxin system RelE/ParE family toxin [Pseudomonas syringae group]KTB83624.1 addiction module toxin RelE [Pseudomonas syringae ICMP 13102]KWT03087.1 addiction module toxin RelE [Pseudomonas syringae pv. avii]MCF5222013.1 type II toxin-antitoxin system RelE/ParE family toxin [Pseudomonas syringae]MCF5243183.1 type II toxin-antitoxin system RelE/ParE family toxin [Pseudomonas syringae]POD63600.1 addiction module toxin RelE [Pseudomonas syringae group genomosp. 3]
MNTFALRFTDVAQQSLEDQVEHLAVTQGLSSAAQRIDILIDAIQDKLLSTPLGYPVSPQLSELGVLHYRELNTDGYRIFYEVMQSVDIDEIVISLVLGGKQSVEQALIRYCLLQPI